KPLAVPAAGLGAEGRGVAGHGGAEPGAAQGEAVVALHTDAVAVLIDVEDGGARDLLGETRQPHHGFHGRRVAAARVGAVERVAAGREGAADVEEVEAEAAVEVV